jgi:hypothetical protein
MPCSESGGAGRVCCGAGNELLLKRSTWAYPSYDGCATGGDMLDRRDRHGRDAGVSSAYGEIGYFRVWSATGRSVRSIVSACWR